MPLSKQKRNISSLDLTIIEIIKVHRVIVGKSAENAGKSPVIFGAARFLFSVASQSHVVVCPSVLYGDGS